jgi:RimJ/RimL family protein N-acetyltransferase
MNDPEVTRYLESRFYPNSVESLQEYVKGKIGDPNNVFMAMVLKANDAHIGNIKLGPIDWIHRLADIGVMIGDKSSWGKGYASAAIRMICDYGFHTLNLHKLTAGCYVSNLGSLKAFQKNGFQVEGVRKQHAFLDGGYEDVQILGLINPRHPGEDGP